jgi:tetratricopeptide (TPR) repeat protein
VNALSRALFSNGRPRAAAFAVVAMLALVSFGPSLRVGFIWDDHEMLEKNPFITRLSIDNLRHAFTNDVFEGKGNDYYRPVQTVMNMIDYRFWGLRPVGYHITNLAYHAAAAALLLLLLATVLPPWTAFGAAAFFAVNPVVVEQFLTISGRAELMSAAFMFAGLWCAIRPGAAMRPVSWVLFALSVFSKESGAVFPLFLAALGVFDRRWRRPWWEFIPLALILAAYLAIRSRVVTNHEVIPPLHEALLFTVRDFPTVLADYLRLILLPVDLYSHRRMFFPHIWMWLCPLMLIALESLAVRRPSRIVAFGAAWFFNALLPKYPVLAANSLMLDHWAYLSGIGVYIVLARGGERLAEKRLVLVLAAGCVMVSGWAALSWASIARRDTDEKLYLWALRHPTSSVVPFNLGVTYLEQGRLAEAEPLLRQALRENPAAVDAANGLALVLWRTGRKTDAVALLNEWAAKRPGYAPTFMNRALMTEGAAALADLDRASALAPNNPRVWRLKADALYSAGRRAEAMDAYDQLLRVDAADTEAALNAAVIATELGRASRASELIDGVLRRDPNNARAKALHGLVAPHNSPGGRS